MPNRLALETSPYLRQHADNPVDWQPWGEEALARARAEDKPILLSIGYSACHWCHVMAHESFEDDATAALMNRLFVNIKVDREERPDLDHIYQNAHQMLTQRAGGWPLTMFLTPDGRPFHGGTYFPKAARFGLPAFADLLERVAEVWRRRRDEIEAQGDAVVEALSPTPPTHSAEAFDAELLGRVTQALTQQFDPVHGGMGGAPKFPRPSELAFLLRRHYRTQEPALREHVLLTLRKMAEGGIHDQLGGGFCRYSVDAEWSIPHFEKMLYDNALLLAVYVDAWCLTREPLFERVVGETVAWVLREMQGPEGGFFAALDADSEGEEGRFYVWDAAEVKARLDPATWAVASRHWGLDGPANFEGHAWHLRVARPLDDVTRELALDPGGAETRLREAREILLREREHRVRPGCDDKRLAGWNALMIAALARVARVFPSSPALAAARRALAFVLRELWRGDRLRASWKDGQAPLAAYLDDYAFLLDALVSMAQVDYRTDDLGFAREVAEALIAGFEDRDRGGFHFTHHDHEALIQRPRPVHDSALPAGCAIAIGALRRLAVLLDEPRYGDIAERALEAHLGEAGAWLHAAPTLLLGFDERLSPLRSVKILGGKPEGEPSLRRLAEAYLPDVVVWHVDGSAAAMTMTLCTGTACLPPETDPEKIIDQLLCNA